MTDRIETKAALTVSETGEIVGLAWPFSGPDSVGDIIEPGAFAFPSSLPICLEHDQRQVVGVWESFSETERGLEVKGRLFVEGVNPAQIAHQRIKQGMITGLSVAFRPQSQEKRPEGGRVFKAVSVTEISLCRVPVHPGARITIVKSENPQVENEELTPEAKTPANDQPQIELKAFEAVLSRFESRLDKVEARSNRPGAPAIVQGDDTEKKAFVTFLQGGQIERKALTVANDAPSYVLAPEETSSEFIRNLVEFSPVRSIADVRTAGSHKIILPKRTGVTNAVWRGETAARTASEPTFDEMEIDVKEMNTFVDLSQWMIEDSANVEAEVRLALAEDFGAKEGLAFVNGGALPVEPQGFMTATGIAETNNGHAANLSADALIKLLYAMPATYRSRGTWVMNGTTLAAVRLLKDGHGNYLWQPSYQAGQPETILGRPVVEMKDMGDIASGAFPIIFGDFKAGFRVYDRIDLDIRIDPYTQATNGLVRFHARRRVGAGVVRTDVFRKLKMAA